MNDVLTFAEIDADETIRDEQRQVRDYAGPHTADCPDTSDMPHQERICTGSCVRVFDSCPALPPF